MADETTTTTTETTPAQPVKPVTQPTTPAEDAPTLSQKQVDAIMGNTRKQATAEAGLALAKKLGFETVEEMEAAAKEAQELKKKNQSDLEKETERANKAEAKAAEKEAKLAEVEAARIADKVDNKILALAKDAKAKNPEDVVERLRNRRAEDLAKVIGEDGKLDDKAIEKLVASVKTDRPEWFGISGPGSPSNRDGRPPQPDNKVVLGKKITL